MEAMERGRANRSSTIKSVGIDVKVFKEEVRAVKTRSLGPDSSLVEEFATNVEANGGHVFFANRGEDAIEYITKLCDRVGAKRAVKAKSLTSEEIELNQGLEKHGIKAIETDLGELICQLAGEKPSHLVFPAVHKSVDQVASIFAKEYSQSIPADATQILAQVRRHLRPIFLSAEVGITGGNIGIAESGTIVLETNEGNGRLVTNLPKIHVVIIGIEKIVKSWEDASRLVEAHAISATGQKVTVYVSCISGRVPLGSSSQPQERELYVVLLDNGRSRMRNDHRFADALNCIRCGACMNICPTYGVVGGHVFGYIYPGPIGIPWTANVHGIDNATFSHLCISCGLCKEICPADIDIPMMIANVKQEEIQKYGQIRANEFFTSSETVAKLASATAPVSNWIMSSGVSRYLLEKIVGVDKRRTLPNFSRKRLGKRLAALDKSSSSSLPRVASGAPKNGEGRATTAVETVIFFPDLYADYNDPELGIRAIKILRSLGYFVVIPPKLKWSGMPYISYGEVDKAKNVARHNVRVLKEHITPGSMTSLGQVPSDCWIVSTEPTAVYMLRQVYPKLLEDDAACAEIAKRSYSFFEFIEGRLPEIELKPVRPVGEPLGFHIPCHERALTSGRSAIRFLERAGYTVNVVETGTCCGMAGTFGMKTGPLGYDLSMAVGDELFKRFARSGCTTIVTESSVCAIQIQDGLKNARVVHPLYLVG